MVTPATWSGSAYRGSSMGIRGGEILIHGNAGNEVGNAMRRGLIAIGGDCGDFGGVNMRAGTLVVLGRLGSRCGASMKRGSIVSMQPAPLLPTFGYACRYEPLYLRLYLLHLKRLGMSVGEATSRADTGATAVMQSKTTAARSCSWTRDGSLTHASFSLSLRERVGARGSPH